MLPPLKLSMLMAAGLAIPALGKARVDLPPPPGPCDVYSTTTKLVDESREDPFSVDGRKRALMASTYIPTQCAGHYDNTEYNSYIPSNIALSIENDARLWKIGFTKDRAESLRTRVAKPNPFFPPTPEKDSYPVVIFSPGFSSFRLAYTQILQAVASQGIVVVSLDHPHDCLAVEFPDGYTVTATNIVRTIPDINFAQSIRVQDFLFTLNQLSSNTDLIPISFANHLNLDHVTVAGHSLGGSSAATAMLNETRFASGIDLDGELYGSVIDKGLDRPFILLGASSPLDGRDESWRPFLNHSTGYKPVFQLDNSTHATFSDMSLLLQSLDLSDEERNTTTSFVGGLPGKRVRDILADSIVAAARLGATGEKTAPLSDASKYPEIKALRE